jgi:folylpolyglutamate synthase/dihydropteroate synthase
MSYLVLVLLLTAKTMVCSYLCVQKLSDSFIDPLRENPSYYQKVWEDLGGNFTVHTTANLDAAMSLATRLEATNVLITGSLHLVGHALQVLRSRTV